MIPTFIPDETPEEYNDYGVPPTVPYAINNVTIGPKGTSDISEGLTFKFWALYAIGNDLIIEDIDQSSTSVILIEPSGFKNVSLAFDQNANDTYAYITGTGELKLRWFDASLSGYTTDSFGQAQSLTLTLDMKYYTDGGDSDILMFYIRDNAIYFRVQREKYEVEHATPVTSGANKLFDSGMRKDYRFQVRWV